MRAFNAKECVEIDGKEYALYIDIGVIDQLEDEFDCSFDQLMSKIGSGSVRMGKMARLVRGLLSQEHPELTPNEVASLIFTSGEAISKAMERLFTKAWPEQTEQAKGQNPRKARRGTGAAS